MARFGVAGEVVGTPPFIAPEALRNQALDHRADLFSLGALAYWLLTRRHAFPAKRISELSELWRRRPAAPSMLVPGIPAELDALVLSLLSLEPEMRPESAAEAINRLRAIAGLEREDEPNVAHSFFLSSALVGNRSELERIKACVDRALEGRGGVILVEGAQGVGRSRLLREAALVAQLAGAVVLRAEGTGRDENFAVCTDLVRMLLHSAPELANAPDPAIRSRLAHLLPELAKLPARVSEDAVERRLWLHGALILYFSEVARQAPLAIVVDDVHRADEPSLAVLVALARIAQRSKLALFVTALSSSGETSSESQTLSTLKSSAEGLRLHRLGPGQTNDLVRGLFGAAPRVDRLGAWLYERTHGYPQQCIELCQNFVEQGIIRYRDGIWVLPGDLSAAALPENLAQAVDAKILALTPGARALLEVMGIARGALPLHVSRAAAIGLDDFFAALDELVSQGFVMAQGDDYALAQAAVRDAALRRLTPERRRALHARIGRELGAASPGSPNVGLEAGWHLLRGGEESQGADLLARCGRELAARGDVSRRVFDALEEALEVYEREARPRWEVLRLKSTLIMSSYQFDRSLAIRHGRSTVDELFRISGLALARDLRRRVGGRAALYLGLATATALRALRPEHEQGPPTVKALQYFTRCVCATLGVHALCLETARVNELYEYVRPLAGFPERSAPYAIFLTCRAMRLQALGRESEQREVALRALELLRDESACPELTRVDRESLLIGIYLGLGINEAYRGHSQALEYADRLEQIDRGLAQLAAYQVRYSHDLLRGELSRAEPHRVKIEEYAMHGGVTWQVEFFSAAIEGLVGAITDDIVSQKRAVETLRLLRSQAPLLAPCCDGIEAGYCLSLGEFERARDLAGFVADKYPPRTMIGWPAIWAALAAAHVGLGDHAAAQRVCRQALAAFREEDKDYVCFYGMLEGALGLAEIGLGNARAALELGETALNRDAVRSHPLMCGILHAMSMLAAATLHDEGGLDYHALEMRRAFLSTRNPALLRRADRALAQAMAKLGREPLAQAVTITLDDTHAARSSLTGVFFDCDDQGARAARALHVLIEAANGIGGHLYMREAETLRLMASLYAEPPAFDLERRVHEAIRAALPPDETVTVVSDPRPRQQSPDTPDLDRSRAPCIFPLLQQRRPVGALVLLPGDEPLRPPRAELMSRIVAKLV